jgi:alkaline phosphatase
VRFAIRVLLVVASVFIAGAAGAAAPKYIFVFIGDGMSSPQRKVAEEFSVKTGLGRLAMNHLPKQASAITKSANKLVTDSAAAATAIACGVRTRNGSLGIAPDGKRVESVAEIAKKRGMKVGLISTVAIAHATPAGFYAHRKSRGQHYRIGLDLIASGFDHFSGGGVFGNHNDKKCSDYRGDLFELAAKAGYEMAFNRAEWERLGPGGKSWCVFGSHATGYDIDHDGKVPRLPALLEKCISLIDNPAGFFIMCEGGMIDYAGHANDAATNVRDMLALDEAVKVALKFQDAHPDETLIITVGDHETGGMSMGFAGSGSKFKIELLAGQKMSCEKYSSFVKRMIAKKKCEVTLDDLRPTLAEYFGLTVLSAAEERLLVSALENDIAKSRGKVADTTHYMAARKYIFAKTAVNVLNARAGVSWSTGSHTALPVLVTAKGPGSDILDGLTELSHIGIRLKKLVSGGETR